MDWTKAFIEKHSDKKEIANLEKEKFYGYVQLNFHEGKVISLAKHQTIK